VEQKWIAEFVLFVGSRKLFEDCDHRVAANLVILVTREQGRHWNKEDGGFRRNCSTWNPTHYRAKVLDAH
jgi:hypothetical protein